MTWEERLDRSFALVMDGKEVASIVPWDNGKGWDCFLIGEIEPWHYTSSKEAAEHASERAIMHGFCNAQSAARAS